MRTVQRTRLVPRANVLVRVEGPDGVRVERGHNLVTITGLNLLRDLLAPGSALTGGITEFGIGSSAVAVAAGDNDLGAEILRDDITSFSDTTPTQLTVKYFLSGAIGNGSTVREAALFAGEAMYARYVLATPIVKTALLSVTFVWELTWEAEE